MRVKNISGEVQVVFVGNQKIRLGIGEERDFDPATGQTLLNEFAGTLARAEVIVETDKLLISDSEVAAGQEVITEAPKKTRKTKANTAGE